MDLRETLTKVEVIGARLTNNFDLFARLGKGKAVFPVLKSDAYGHGIVNVLRLLAERQVPLVAVQTIEEARTVTEASPRKPLIIGPTTKEEVGETGSTAVLTVAGWNQLHIFERSKQKLSVHLKVNTGMNRQGFEPAEIPEVLCRLRQHPRISLEGVFSHFADADNADNSFTKMQEETFSKCLDLIHEHKFYPQWIHLGNSAGFLKTTDNRINAGRPGIGLYGYNPLSAADPLHKKLNRLQPALRLVSTVTSTHRLQPGAKVSYNGTFTAPSTMHCGVVPVGYFEALDRKLSNAGVFLHRKSKTPMPILGRVCMNLTCFGSEQDIAEGDEMILIGEESDKPNSVEQIAKSTDTIPYEVLTRIHRSLPRKIV